MGNGPRVHPDIFQSPLPPQAEGHVNCDMICETDQAGEGGRKFSRRVVRAVLRRRTRAGNVALAYSLPDDARFIVSGMDIEYTKKARGTITAVGQPPVPRTAARAQYDVPVTLRDAGGDEVARVVLHSLVGPKPGSALDRGDVN